MKVNVLDPIPLGCGSFGTVFKATQIKDGRRVCVKIGNDILDEVQKKKIELHIKKLKKLSHPNILNYIHSFWEDNKFCIVME
jgi:serine/threonine protein kinase